MLATLVQLSLEKRKPAALRLGLELVAQSRRAAAALARLNSTPQQPSQAPRRLSDRLRQRRGPSVLRAGASTITTTRGLVRETAVSRGAHHSLAPRAAVE